MLFSATQTKKVEDLSKLALSKEPLYIGVDDTKSKATNEGLQQVWLQFPGISDFFRTGLCCVSESGALCTPVYFSEEEQR